MNSTFANSEGLQTKGSQFSEYAENLKTLLGEIDADIDNIVGGELEGSAVKSLVTSYEKIRVAINAHIAKIENLGGAVTEIGKERSEINESASAAAQGTGV